MGIINHHHTLFDDSTSWLAVGLRTRDLPCLSEHLKKPMVPVEGQLLAPWNMFPRSLHLAFCCLAHFERHQLRLGHVVFRILIFNIIKERLELASEAEFS